jgi:hypothetical protein
MSGEPANFSPKDLARWLATRPRARKRPPGPRPTLAQLHKGHCWLWLWCERCQHHAPMAVTPLIIRWGPDASSDKLRECARCTACGSKGATLQHPGWAGAQVGFLPFPVGEMEAAGS